MKIEVDMPEHHYNNIMSIDSACLGRAPYKGIIMYAINAIKHGRVLDQEPQSFKWCTGCREYDQEKHCCHRWSKVIRDTVEEMKQEPKTGYWVGIDEEPHEDYECSYCGYVVSTFTANIKPHTEYKFCPNCGCRMIEPQESEDKE